MCATSTMVPLPEPGAVPVDHQPTSRGSAGTYSAPPAISGWALTIACTAWEGTSKPTGTPSRTTGTGPGATFAALGSALVTTGNGRRSGGSVALVSTRPTRSEPQ